MQTKRCDIAMEATIDENVMWRQNSAMHIWKHHIIVLGRYISQILNFQ